jgi:hypothetical protein
MILRCYIAGLCLLLVVSCNTMMEKPKYPIIPKKEFIHVLVEMHLAEGIANTSAFKDTFCVYKSISLPDSFLKQNGYSRAIFDSTVSYYSAYPKAYDEIYDEVIAELSRMDAETQKEIQKKEKLK